MYVEKKNTFYFKTFKVSIFLSEMMLYYVSILYALSYESRCLLISPNNTYLKCMLIFPVIAIKFCGLKFIKKSPEEGFKLLMPKLYPRIINSES